MDEHRQRYPEQYTHPLCGKPVKVNTGKVIRYGFVSRVVPSRFGPLAILDDNPDEAWSIKDCEVTPRCPNCGVIGQLMPVISRGAIHCCDHCHQECEMTETGELVELSS